MSSSSPYNDALRTLQALFLPAADAPAYEQLAHADDLRFEIRCLHGKGRPRQGRAPNEWFPLSGAGVADAAAKGVVWGRSYDVYVSVLPRQGYGRGAETVPAGRALWASIDDNDFPGGALDLLKCAHDTHGLPAPHLALASGGGIHAAWLLSETYPLAAEWQRDRYQRTVRRLSLLLAAVAKTELPNYRPIYRESDSVINSAAPGGETSQVAKILPAAEAHKDALSTLLRLPGSRNHKAVYGDPRPVRLVRCSPWVPERQPLTWWRAQLPPEPAPPVRQVRRDLPRTEGLARIPAEAQRLLSAPAAPHTRHDAAKTICASLFGAGWPADAVHAQLALFADNNGWRTEKGELRKLVNYFAAKHQGAAPVA